MQDYYCWLGVAMCAHLCPDMLRLARDEFGWSGVGLATLTEFFGKKVFYYVLHKLSND